MIGVFACCREIFDSHKHCGYFGGTQIQAYAQLDKKRRDEALVRAEERTNEELKLMVQELAARNTELLK